MTANLVGSFGNRTTRPLELVLGLFLVSPLLKKTQIPDEPSYLLLNTAISSTWGFPEGTEAGCPAGCQCGCYDCLAPKSDRSGQCTCGFDKGFCAMLPAHFLVDYVRVWQATPTFWVTHTVGKMFEAASAKRRVCRLIDWAAAA